MKNYYFFVLAAIFPLLFIVDILFAQDIHYTQINATPLAVNPAFTGMFDGSLRASAIYRTQWEDVTIPYTTVGASVDIPIYLNKYGNYLAAGVQFMRDAAGDGNLINADGLFSLAYHKFYGLSQYLKRHKGAELGIGVQAGFGNREFDISGLYFNDKLSELPYHFNPGNA